MVELIGSLLRLVTIFAIIRVPIEFLLNGEYRQKASAAIVISILIEILIIVSIYGTNFYFEQVMIYDLIGISIVALVAWSRFLQRIKFFYFFKKPFVKWPTGILMWLLMFSLANSFLKEYDPYYLSPLFISTYLAYLIVRKKKRFTTSEPIISHKLRR